MPVAGALHDFPLPGVFAAVGQGVGRLIFTGLPTIGRLELDVDEGMVRACRVGADQVPVKDPQPIIDKLILVGLAGTGEFSFKPTQAPSLQQHCEVPLDQVLKEVQSKCDEIRTSARDFDQPAQKFRWINNSPVAYSGELGVFIRETSAMLRRGTSANEIAQTLLISVAQVQFFLLYMKEEGLIAIAEPPPGRTRAQMQHAKGSVQEVPASLPPGTQFDTTARWFYLDGEKEVGPVGEDVIMHRISLGQIQSSSLVWRQGLSRWTPFEDVQALDRVETEKRATEAKKGTTTEAGECYVCQKNFPRTQMMHFQSHWICEDCRPAFFNKLTSVGFQLASDRKAVGQLGPRLGAVALDLVLYVLVITCIWIVAARLGAISPSYFISYGFLFADVLGSVVWAGGWLALTGTTPGKWVFHLRVVDAVSDHRVRPQAALKRSAAALIPLGFIVAFFNPQRRALNDYVARTRVIHWTISSTQQ